MVVRRPKGDTGSKVLSRKGRRPGLFEDVAGGVKVMPRKSAFRGELQHKGWDQKVGPKKKHGVLKSGAGAGSGWTGWDGKVGPKEGMGSGKRERHEALRAKRLVGWLALMVFSVVLLAWVAVGGSESGIFYFFILMIYAVIRIIGGKHDKS